MPSSSDRSAGMEMHSPPYVSARRAAVASQTSAFRELM